MHRVLHLLTIIAVLLCGLHIGEPAHAFEGVQHALTQADEREAGQSGTADPTPAKAAHGGHAHCPVAPAHNDALEMGAIFLTRAVFSLPAIASLPSRSIAPLIEPPAA